MDFRIMVLPGDGIGTEVVPEAVRVLERAGKRAGHTFHFTWDDIGGVSIDKYGIAVRPQTLEAAAGSDAVLFGAVGGPKWDDPTAPVRPEQGLLAIRKALGLFANLRPVKVYPSLIDASPVKPEVLRGVDLVVVRELTGGLYFGEPRKREKRPDGWWAVDTMVYTEQEIRRILHVGFELARGRRRRLASVDKANVLDTSRLWRQLAIEMGRDYPDVILEHLLVDSAAMQLVQRPTRFDVIVTENMFGDILTDEAAVLSASMGLLPSASLAGVPQAGKRALGLYEPIHGSAPDIAGQGKANPIATVLSAALMLRYSLGLATEADAIEKAVADVIDARTLTADLTKLGAKSTSEVSQAILARL